MQPIAFDKQGRMQFHPEFHAKHGTPWTNHDQTYLLEQYVKLGPEEVSLALERPIGAIMRKYSVLRKKGLAPAEPKRKYHKRMMTPAKLAKGS